MRSRFERDLIETRNKQHTEKLVIISLNANPGKSRSEGDLDESDIDQNNDRSKP